MKIDPELPRKLAQIQVQVKFVTRDTEVSVSAAPILVPSNLKRFGLSQVVNHLLDAEKPVPFDFLIDGAYLRTTLDEYITTSGLSSESIITLEYVRAAVPPKFLASFQHDDWVSSVATSPHSPDPVILSGSFDGIARVWNTSGQVLGEAVGHTSAIKAAQWIDADTFATGGMDRTLRLWRYRRESLVEAAIKPIAEYVGHKSTVDSLSVHTPTSRILTGSTDGTVGLWCTKPKESPAAPPSGENDLPVRVKKRKLAASVGPKAPQYGALAHLSGHTSPVSEVAFAPQDPTVAYSVSWDHTVRTWDLTTLTLVDTKTTQHPILSVCSLPELHLLACASSAGHIILHDPRVSATGVSSATLRGHSNVVVALSARPDSGWELSSAGYDGTVRVWDVRAANSGNLFTIQREVGGAKKVFDVEWSNVGIVSGGEDKRVQINSTPREEGWSTKGEIVT